MIIDSHAHIFPWLGGAAGYESAELHRLYLQKGMVDHVQPVHRFDSNEIVAGSGLLWDPDRPGISGYREVMFEVLPYGRFAWTTHGERYYLQYMPPALQANEAPAEFLIALMDHAGVDVAVLQNDHLYGDLNQYFAQAVRTFPERFIGLIQVDETIADHEEQVARLHDGTKSGLRGLYYKPAAFFRSDFREFFDAPRFAGFWSEVESLKLPTYWDLVPLPRSTRADYLDQLTRFASWCERYPEVPCLLVMGMPTRLFFESGRLEVPPLLVELARARGVLVELTLPIAWGRWHEYPFQEIDVIARTLYDLVGASSLVWGSDVPNVERYCTYQQSLNYLSRICPFLSQADLNAILGDNLQPFFS